MFTRLTERFGVPTVDLTVHIRSIEALQRMSPDDWMAARFRTTVATEGFLEEDGQLWAPDGTLIAHSRQLACPRSLIGVRWIRRARQYVPT